MAGQPIGRLTGTGRVDYGTPAAGDDAGRLDLARGDAMSDIDKSDDVPEIPEVEVVCPSCHGKGGDKIYPCPYCDGLGHVPTAFGRKVLDMVLRHLGKALRDAIDR